VSTSVSDSNDGVLAGRTAEDLIIKRDDIRLFNSVRAAQEWRVAKPSTDPAGHARKIPVSELQVVREVLFMLQGLDTTIFDSRCTPLPAFQTSHLIWDTHRTVINTFSESGRQLRILRIFVQSPRDTSNLQAFQDSVAKRLHDFDRKLSAVHARLASSRGEAVVITLISLKSELTPWLEPLYALSNILVRIDQEPDPGAFRYLELLFDEASMVQLSGKTETYRFLARIFVECFNVYLRPVRLWMDEGRLLPGDKIFFVYETAREITLSEIWRRRFKLRVTQDGRLHAPSFLHPAVGKIINAGKNLVVLARLGQSAYLSRTSTSEPPLDYDAICPPGLDLAPFPDLFASAFDRWIQSKYRATSTTLKDVLIGKCGLSTALTGLQHLYFMSDGHAASTLCEELFDRMDLLKPRWHDRYALTASGQGAFGHLVDAERLSVSVDEDGQGVSVVEARDLVRSALPHIRITYRLPWSVQMVLSPGSNEHYQSVFSLLLQFKRATHILHKSKILHNYWTDHENWGERALYYSCRNKLLWFCTTIQTYLSSLVLTPNVLRLRKALDEAQDVDGITDVHDKFVKQVVDEACLGSRLTPIRECMLDVLDLAIRLEQRKDEEDGYVDVLKGVEADFEKHLRFICGGLRSVARASSDVQAAKWDTLAEMLQMGASSGMNMT
jgi:gamma-tubulin complex component 5